MKLMIILLTILALVGCVPYPPHSTVNAPRYSGRVVSATTHRPIGGASVVLHGLDDSSTLTDEGGRFVTRVSRSWHLAAIYTYDDGIRLQIPPSRSSDGKLFVSHLGYRAATIQVGTNMYPNPLQKSSDVIIEQIQDVYLHPVIR